MNLTSNGKLGRRDFLAATAATAVSAMLPAAGLAAAPEPEWRNRQPEMTYRRLGRTGCMVSSMGLGGDDIAPDNLDLVYWAMDQGVNYFDTAPHYNNFRSEPGYAAVLKARGRDKVFQNSKCNVFGSRTVSYQTIFRSLPDAEQAQIRARVMDNIAQKGIETPDYLGPYFTGQETGLRNAAIANILSEKYSEKIDAQKQYKQYIISSVEGSLKTLGTDHLDCILMRGVETPYEISHTPEVFEAFEILKKQGKARFLGFTAHSDPAGVLDAAIDTGVYSMGMIAYNFFNDKWVGPVIEKAKKADFGVLSMKASRVVQNGYNRRQLVPDRVKRLNAAVPGDLTLFQKGFRWVLQNPNLSGVVAGITNMDMAKEDIPMAMTKASA
jgi:predicted aldo/keto reductase-like oxidoreductase